MKDIFRLFGYARGLYKYVIFVAIAGTLIALLDMIAPFVIKFATDAISLSISSKTALKLDYLILLLIILAISYISSAILGNINGYIGDVLAAKMRFKLSCVYYDHLLILPQSYYDNENTGKIISRLDRAIADVTRFINMFSNVLLQMLLTVVISVGVMLWYSWEIAIIVVLQIPIYIYITMLTSKRWQKMEDDKNQHLDIARGRFSEVIGNMRLVKSFGTERRESRFFAKNFNQTVDITKYQSKYWHSMDTIRSLVQVSVYIIVYAILFWRAAKGQITMGDLILIITLLQQTSRPMQNMSFFVDMYQRAVANSKDYAKVMLETPEIAKKGGEKITSNVARVEYENVTFAYDDKPIIRNVSFAIEPGEKLALVSASGGGKTTLSNLLMKLYSPNSGKISINNKNIADLNTNALRSKIATVFQDAILFSGTVRENIAYANPKASNKDIERAARAANALGFINELENGFDTMVGERGVKLSGGQRQRIAIARAILKDAPVLILDEATSALDSYAEHEVQKALDRLMKGRTTLIIAHRLSTIANVDKIVTLKDGKIDEIGTPFELAKTNGIYSQLLNIQVGATKDAKKKLQKFDIAG